MSFPNRWSNHEISLGVGKMSGNDGLHPTRDTLTAYGLGKLQPSRFVSPERADCAKNTDVVNTTSIVEITDPGFTRHVPVIRLPAPIISKRTRDSSETTSLAAISACAAPPSCPSCPWRAGENPYGRFPRSVNPYPNRMINVSLDRDGWVGQVLSTWGLDPPR